jgi:hypothetical protein
MLDMPANCKIIALPDDHPRLKIGPQDMLKYSDADLLDAVKQYELWRESNEFRLHYTVCREIAGSEDAHSLFEAYDVISREIARRLFFKKT